MAWLNLRYYLLHSEEKVTLKLRCGRTRETKNMDNQEKIFRMFCSLFSSQLVGPGTNVVCHGMLCHCITSLCFCCFRFPRYYLKNNNVSSQLLPDEAAQVSGCYFSSIFKKCREKGVTNISVVPSQLNGKTKVLGVK